MAKQQSAGSAERNLVEFYDHEHLENVISLLLGEYSEVTYVYFKHANEPSQRERQMLKRFIPQKFRASVRFLEISENSISCALDAFRKLISSGGFYDFDITGGSSIFIAAAGSLFAEDQGRRMGLHEYDVKKGSCTFCHPRDAKLPLRKGSMSLSVPDVFSLKEITVLDRGRSVCASLKDETLRREIGRLWSVVRKNFRAWNEFCKIPTTYSFEEKQGVLVEKRCSRGKYDEVQPIFRGLAENCILEDLQEQDMGYEKIVTFRLQIRQEEWFLYAKGGNLLEMLTSLAVVDSGICSDCCTGIKLDWERQEKETEPNPYNEIDVVAVQGHIPCFISCKNTTVTKENLYEIMTMTRHYGGAYAIPVMVSTDEGKDGVRARAKEMNVVLIDTVKEMTAETFSKAVQKALQKI